MSAPFRGRRLSDAELTAVLDAHTKYRLGQKDGEHADLGFANLRGADLVFANLRGADLGFANLRGANLRGADGVLCLGPCEGWIMYAVRYPDGPRIHAGCRWFTREQAAAHWNGSERKEHDERMMAGVAALCALGRAHGWEGCE